MRFCTNNLDSRDIFSYLGNTPWDEEWSLFGVWQHTTGSIIETKVRRTVNDDTLHRYAEPTVETDETVSFEDFRQTIT